MMARLIACLIVGMLHEIAVGADEFHFIDLTNITNQKLVDNLGRGFSGNHLKDLPVGEQTFAKLPFFVGDGIVQLGSKVLSQYPDKIERIPIEQPAKAIHFLHATQFGGGPNTSSVEELFVKDGTTIGELVFHFEDNTESKLPLIYGENVRDWWFRPDEKGVKEGAIGWRGDNPWSNQNQCRIRLYVTTWTNESPATRISSLDFVGRKEETVAAPFCVAITVETDKF